MKLFWNESNIFWRVLEEIQKYPYLHSTKIHMQKGINNQQTSDEFTTHTRLIFFIYGAEQSFPLQQIDAVMKTNYFSQHTLTKCYWNKLPTSIVHSNVYVLYVKYVMSRIFTVRSFVSSDKQHRHECYVCDFLVYCPLIKIQSTSLKYFSLLAIIHSVYYWVCHLHVRNVRT